jgi:hypothetical protein
MHFGVTASIDVIQALGDSKRTGTLKIRDDRTSGILWLRSGVVIKAELRSNTGRALSLKEIIFEVLKITEPELSWQENEAEILALPQNDERISIEQALMEFVSQLDGTFKPKYILRDAVHDRTYTLFNGRNLIGRQSTCPICVPHVTVSSEHAIVTVFGDDVIVADLDSLNGTYINDEDVVQETRLTLSDDLRVGDIKLKLEQKEPEPESMINPFDQHQLHSKDTTKSIHPPLPKRVDSSGES